MANAFYIPFVGFPLCVLFCTLGVMLCCTIIFAGVGLALIACGFKVLTLPPPAVVVRVDGRYR